MVAAAAREAAGAARGGRLSKRRGLRRHVATLVCRAAAAEPARVAVLGASGYTGAEVCRLAATHPGLDVVALTAERSAGKRFTEVYPHLAASGDGLPTLCTIGEVPWEGVDAVFCCLPHATTQEVIAGLPEDTKVVDLSADFRLKDVAQYAEWYGGEHKAPDLQATAVYGLTELHRDAVKGARLVANPGCYPTSIQLPLVPLLKEGLVLSEDIIIDSKSGVSGAGRAPKEAFLYGEVAEGMHSYGVSKHRHMPEIEQGLSEAAGSPVTISFTPHLIPMSRGMQSTMYVKLADGATVDGLREALASRYEHERFVRVMPKGVIPHTRHVRGSNYCHIAVAEDRIPGRAIIISVIDNLVKGASGQAIQNMNLVLGLPEDMGLMQEPMFP